METPQRNLALDLVGTTALQRGEIRLIQAVIGECIPPIKRCV